MQTYLENPEQFSFSLPEVIFVRDVPIEQVKVSEQQPKLEARLKELSGPERLALIETIGKTPGLER